MFGKLKDKLTSKETSDTANKHADKALANKDAGKHAGSVAEKIAKKSGLGMFSREIGAGVKAVVEGKQKANAEAKATGAPATVTTTQQSVDQKTGEVTTTEVVATTTVQPAGGAVQGQGAPGVHDGTVHGQNPVQTQGVGQPHQGVAQPHPSVQPPPAA